MLRSLAPRAKAVPRGGWISALRQSLGMTLAELGGRMGVSAVSVSKLEESERRSTIQLDSLQRAALALNCEVVYALVPREPLNEMVFNERVRQLDILHARTSQHMHLENQGVDDAAYREHLRREAETMVSDRQLWK
ncbi:MAG TPA: helix-turn-helix domain-containing protein [Stenotrophomonas sp.]